MGGVGISCSGFRIGIQEEEEGGEEGDGESDQYPTPSLEPMYLGIYFLFEGTEGLIEIGIVWHYQLNAERGTREFPGYDVRLFSRLD